ncbi:MAG: diguanylate cyclase, partial [Kangiellaceae bacterium]|nr:diguanylate cyclase [Kangiellaceae bacterium]
MADNKKIKELIGLLDPAWVEQATRDNQLNLPILFEQVASAFLVNQPSARDTASQSLDSDVQPLDIHAANSFADTPPESQNGDNDHATNQAVLPKSSGDIDPLTRLPNRLSFKRHVEQAIKRASRHSQPFAIVFIDIDHFKAINDTHGHQVGDKLLKVLSQRILSSIRQTDTLCRLAGDEFCLLVEELESIDAILKVIETIRTNISKPFEFDDLSLIVTCSIGVSTHPDDALDYNDLLHFADCAMYEAKHSGRNSVSLFSPELSEKIKRVTHQRKTLSDAIANSEYQTQLQPELNLANGELSAVRLITNLSSPMLDNEKDILKTAARSKNLPQLNLEIVKNACELMTQWQSDYQNLPTLIIPLFREFALSPRCAATVEGIIAKYPISGSSIEFEFDGLSTTGDFTSITPNLAKLHKLGCRISIINLPISSDTLPLIS